MNTLLAPRPASVDIATEPHPADGQLARPRRWSRPERPSASGRYLAFEGGGEGFIALDRDVMHVGRGLSADVRLDDHRVSRRHAILVRRAAGHRLLDDRSANGTMVNGRRVEQVELTDGDLIVLGRSILRYVVVS